MDEDLEKTFRDLAEGAEQRKKRDPRLAAAEKEVDDATRVLLEKHSERPEQRPELETGWVLRTTPESDDPSHEAKNHKNSDNEGPDHNGLS